MAPSLGCAHPDTPQHLASNYWESVRRIDSLYLLFLSLTVAYTSSAYFGMLFSVFIPPMFPVQIYLVVRASSRGS
jgi:hypothetical protein